MSARSSSTFHSHLDTLIVPKRHRRRLSLPSQHEKPTNLQVFSQIFSSCKNGACSRASILENSERRREAYMFRRSFFDKAHLRPPVCAMEHLVPICTGSGTRKRSLDFREHSYVMSEKRHKVCNLKFDTASVKSTRSKEMVSHKYRTVDSLQRSGASNTEKQKGMESSDSKGRRSSRITKKEGSALPDINGTRSNTSLVSATKDSLSSYEDLLEDWTQEHLLEPRRTEKRKSLDELQATEGAPLVMWRRKSRRGIRREESTANEVLETIEDPKHVQSNAGPAEELQRSLSSSENQGFDDASDSAENEKICLKYASDYKKDCIISDQRLFSTGQSSKQQITDSFGGVQEEASPSSQPQENASGFCSLVQRLETSHVNFCNEPFSKPLNGVKASSKDHCASLDQFDVGKPLSMDEFPKTLLPDSRQEDTLPILKEKSVETFGTSDQGNEMRDAAYEGEVRLNELEGRKCGLCGGDSRGEPAKYLLPVSTKRRDNQHLKSDQTSPLYSEWDAFGNEPGWLGPLLGPLGDHFGIAGVWVHQECAIWSPEVYFAGIGRLKNIRAALRRGKFLKCSRCTRPGATIGCRIERCPRTYHLPCARFEGCYFDPKKFLMACDEHLHHFLPRLPGHRHHRSSLNMGRIRFKRKVSEWKKTAQRAAQGDAEAEEKWQEKAGVDEEFLRRERKRFQRDIARVAPVMVGGGTEQYKFQGWESIAGSDNVIQCMKEMVILPLLYPEAFARLGVSPPRGVLLHGHPGTGKTLAVKALVGACAKGHKQIAYFARKGADCLGKYAGDAERQLRMLFYLAEKHQPSIIFFDEIDGLAPTRSQHQDQTQKSVVSTLLALMDGIKSRGSVVVIGATNRPDALDPALRRPGRFDREIYFPLPSFLGRSAILTLLTKNWQMPPKHEVISLLASKTIGFAGADLQALCAQAAINSLRRMVSVDYLMSLVEKQGNIPSFPDLRVSTADWATALEQVSPPCSWRSAKAAVNTVICAPVPHHILPVLLWPMVELLLSLHLDNRAALPPVLKELATKLVVTLKHSLGDSWIDQIDSFVHNSTSNFVRKELEQNLEDIFYRMGMVSDGKVRPATSIVPNVAYEGSKFRVMMSGKERAWLDHFAAWIMFGFEGFAEICNLNLTTLLQEGGGDVVQGLIHILGSIQNKSPCVIYMPQVESWAVESGATDEGQEQAEERRASHYWNVFMQQVNLLPSSLQIIFVASSQMRKDDIPLEVVKFFWGTSVSTSCSNVNKSGGSLLQEMWLSFNRSSPCSWVEASLVHDMKTVFSRAADGFTSLFCQELLLHGQSTNKTCTVEPFNSVKHVSFADLLESSPLRGFECGSTEHAFDKVVDASSPVAGLNETGLKADSSHPSSMGSKRACSPGDQQTSLCPPEQNYLPVAISMVGYELLYHPELRDLRHATSKLQEGPSYTTVSPKTALPESTDSSSAQTGEVDTVSLKGLNAVGLLAYSGNYLRARDVAVGVQEVVELLMERINMKVNLGKDRKQFSHLFHKAASLQDKVFMWAYNLRRFDFAPSRPGDNTQEFSAPKSKAGGNIGTCTARICSETKETEGLPTTRALPPKSTGLVEALRGIELDVHVPCSSFECNKTDHGFEGSPPHIEKSEKKLHFNGNTTMDKVNEVMAQQQIVDNTAIRKWCPSCSHLVKVALRRLFMRAWKSRGAELSLNIADEVIGTCASAVSLELNCILANVSQVIPYSAISSCRNGCCCRAHHRNGKASLKLSSSKSELLTNADSDENLTTSSYVCLCSLVKLINELTCKATDRVKFGWLKGCDNIVP